MGIFISPTFMCSNPATIDIAHESFVCYWRFMQAMNDNIKRSGEDLAETEILISTYAVLSAEGIYTVEDLLRQGRTRIKNLSRIGKTRLQEIETLLSKRGLRLPR